MVRRQDRGAGTLVSSGVGVYGAAVRVLFLCLGNICRSPLAEGAFRALLAERGLASHWAVDSAGTGAWHAGEPPDPRSVAVARRHGVDISTQRARQLTSDDFMAFDWIVAMDRTNLTTAQSRRPANARAQVTAFMPHVPDATDRDVPDPYYGGPEGFDHVWQLLVAGMPNLLDAMQQKEHGLTIPQETIV
jgi:protein-tyrosine phosphatase